MARLTRYSPRGLSRGHVATLTHRPLGIRLSSDRWVEVSDEDAAILAAVPGVEFQEPAQEAAPATSPGPEAAAPEAQAPGQEEPATEGLEAADGPADLQEGLGEATGEVAVPEAVEQAPAALAGQGAPEAAPETATPARKGGRKGRVA